MLNVDFMKSSGCLKNNLLLLESTKFPKVKTGNSSRLM